MTNKSESPTALKGLSRNQMAWCAAQDIPDGAFVNLGIGMPEKVAEYLPDDRDVIYHSENGILGMGPTPPDDEIDLELINAGKKPVTEIEGASYFHHADSFAMIRGGHIDICILGAMQIAQNGDLANWSTGAPDAIPGVGGAMDLAVGAKSVIVLTDHVTRNGDPKLVDQCTYPLTGLKCVTRIYSSLGIIDVTNERFVVQALAPGVSFDALQERTGCELIKGTSIRTIECPDLA